MKNHPLSPLQNVRHLSQQIREARANRSIPCLLGQGFVITQTGSYSCFGEGEFNGKKGYNFAGRWNNCVRFTREQAEQIAASIEVPFDIEVVHVNEARDRDEARAIDLLKYYWTNRQSFRAAIAKLEGGAK